MDANEYKYSEKIKIYSFLVDNRLKLDPTSLLGLMQEIAGNHANAINIGWNFLHKHQLFWALIKLHIVIHRLPVWNEIITMKTWEKQHDLLIQPRDYEFFDENGECLIQATSSWVIINREDGKPQHIDNFNHILRKQLDINAIEKRAPKIIRTKHPANLTFQPVIHSDIDMNEHVNNTKYVRWVMDSFNHEFHQTHELKELLINYISQTKFGELYAISTQEIESNNFVTTILSQNELKEICKIQTKWEKRG